MGDKPYRRDGREYRINPRNQTLVEVRIGHDRWQTVRQCDSRDSATTLLRQLAGRPQQGDATR